MTESFASTQSPEPPRPRRAAVWSGTLMALLAGLAVTAVLAYISEQQEREARQQRWLRQVEQVEGELQQRFQRVEQLLSTARALVLATPRGQKPSWEHLVEGQPLPRRLAGLHELQWVQRVPLAQLPDVQVELRQSQQLPQLTLKSESLAPDWLVLSASLPTHPERIGTDLGIDAQLRELLQSVGNQGSGGLTLLEGEGANLVVALPVYRAETEPSTPVQRERTLLGWVLARMDAREWLHGLTRGVESTLPFALFDGPWPPNARLLAGEATLAQGGTAREWRLGQRVLALRFGAEPWRAPLLSWPPDERLRVLLAAGLSLSLLLAAVVARLLLDRERATQRWARSAAELQRLAQVAEYTQQWVLRTDAQGLAEWGNPALLRSLGRSPEQLRGRAALELLGLRDGPDRDALADAMREGRALRMEIEAEDGQGQARWLDLELEPVLDAIGQVEGLVLLGQDCGERRQIQQRLSAALRQHEDLLNTVHQYGIVSVTDPLGNLTEVNDAFCQISGYTRAELIGAPHSIIDSGHHPESFWDQVLRQVRSGQSWRGQICNRAKDGRIFWVDSIIAPFFASDGSIDRYISIRFDITASKAAQAELSRERERLNAIIEGTQAGTWEWNFQSGAVLVNPRLAHMVGERHDQVTHWTLEQWQGYVHPEDQERVREALTRHLSGVSPHYQVDLRLRHVSGRWVWGQLRGTVVARTSKGQPLWLAGTLFDISERRQAEDLVRMRQQVLDRTERMAEIGGFELNLADQRLTWSDQMFRIHGLSPEGAPTLEQSLQYLFEDDQQRLKQAMERAVREDKGWDLELSLLDALGRFIWVRSVGQAEFVGGQAVRIVGAYQDISERRALEEEAQRQQRLLQTVIENLPGGLWVFDEQRRLIAFNQELVRLLDLPEEQLRIGVSTREDLVRFDAARGAFGGPVETEAEVTRLLDLAQSQRPHHYERRRADGRTLDVRGAPMPDGGLVMTYLDVSERKRAEEALRAQEHFVRLVADSVPGRIAYWTRDRRCVFVNLAYCEWVELPRERLLGALMDEVFGERMGQEEVMRVSAVLTGQAQQFERLERQRGQTRHMLVHFVPDERAGQVQGFVVMALDISELKAEQQRTEQLNSDLAVERDRANEASVAKSQFLANMSHEIRTPMNAILGMLKLLKRSGLDARQEDYVGKTEGAARSLLGLLNDILDFSKVEAGKMVLDPQPFALEEMLRNLAVILASTVGAKQLELVFYVDPRVPSSLVADMLRLQQVLINLGGNAVKFTEQGEVVLSLRRLADLGDRVRVEFAVRDSGIGIAQDKQQAIFSGFTQAEASTTRRFGGTGLGLAISQRLVQLMGGEIQLSSQPGFGSRFAFSLELPRSTLRPLASRVQGLRLLVVDDNPVARAALEAMAEGLGWQALLAESGAQALELIELEQSEGRHIDVAVIDWRMPGMDGWETGQALRQRSARIALLGMGSGQERELLAQRGPRDRFQLQGFLVKPVTAGMLDEAVARARGESVAQAAVPQARGAALEGVRLLVVEDNPNNQQVALELLESEGASVSLADHGADALRRLRAEPEAFDLVLMDMQMPVMDGVTATRAIRKELGLTKLPIVAMTANAMAADREACLQAGMNEHVGKPFEMEPLVALIQRLAQPGVVVAPATPRAVAPRVEADRQTLALSQGIDLQAAMDRFLGKTDLYLRMCRSFAKSAKGLPPQLRALMGVSGRQRHEDSQQALHSFKGLAATLAAQELADWGREGEQRAKAGQDLDAAWIDQLAVRIQIGCAALLAHAEALAPEAVKAVAPIVDVGPLRGLLDVLEQRSTQALILMAEQRDVLGPALGEQLDALDEALAEMDFDRAATLVRDRLTETQP